jgi:hypothetical protein
VRSPSASVCCGIWNRGILFRACFSIFLCMWELAEMGVGQSSGIPRAGLCAPPALCRACPQGAPIRSALTQLCLCPSCPALVPLLPCACAWPSAGLLPAATPLSVRTLPRWQQPCSRWRWCVVAGWPATWTPWHRTACTTCAWSVCRQRRPADRCVGVPRATVCWRQMGMGGGGGGGCVSYDTLAVEGGVRGLLVLELVEQWIVLCPRVFLLRTRSEGVHALEHEPHDVLD